MENNAVDKWIMSKTISFHRDELRFFQDKLKEIDITDKERDYCKEKVEWLKARIEYDIDHFDKVSFGRI